MQDTAPTSETMKKIGSEIQINKKFSKKGICLGKCDRDVIRMDNVSTVICYSCKRIVFQSQ